MNITEEEKFKKIIIDFDDEHTYADTLREVLRLVEQGYSSGIDPTWGMEK
jgi:hypothetical protein